MAERDRTSMMPLSNSNRSDIGHLLPGAAASGFRFSPARNRSSCRDAPASFSAITAGGGTRQAAAILAHIGDLSGCALGLADGVHVWKNAESLPWDADVERFFTALERFDRRLASDAPLGFPAARIFRGPIADATTHVGQLAMLRRVAGAPVRAENYVRAAIVAGQVGPDQSGDRTEFD